MIDVVLSDWVPVGTAIAMGNRLVMPSPTAYRREAMNGLLVLVRPARRRAARHRWNARHPRTHRRKA